MREDNTTDFNENDCQNCDSQLLGFLPPGGVLVMSPGAAKGVGRSGIVAMPIAELFVQHKKRPEAEVSPRARVS